MENASKALIMAGSVLIALVIIGALVLTFGNLTSYQKTDTESTRSSQIVEYNSQFETYNRDDVRGSDLYSLLNKVIDYNRRQTTMGTGATDTGQDIRYMPMEITVDFDGKKGELAEDEKKNLLIKDNKYTINEITNTFENDIKNTIDTLERVYGQDSLTNLTTNLTKIFPEKEILKKYEQDKETYRNQITVLVKTFNEASRKIKIENPTDLDKVASQETKKTIREDVYTYYEYVQFKRAHFDCTNIEYDNNTGRITKMDFKFNGNIN